MSRVRWGGGMGHVSSRLVDSENKLSDSRGGLGDRCRKILSQS